MKLVLAVLVVLSLHSVSGHGSEGDDHNEERGRSRPNPYAVCRQLLASTGFRGTESDCSKHEGIVNGEIDQAYRNRQRDVFTVWIRQTAQLYRADVMSLLQGDDDDDSGTAGEDVLALCEKQICFMEAFRVSVEERGIPRFCRGKTSEEWLQEMWAAKHQIERGGRMGVEMVEAFFCARAHNPHLNHRHRAGGRAGRHQH